MSDKTEKRSEQILIRCTSQEREKLQELAKAEGKDMGAFIRSRCFVEPDINNTDIKVEDVLSAMKIQVLSLQKQNAELRNIVEGAIGVARKAVINTDNAIGVTQDYKADYRGLIAGVQSHLGVDIGGDINISPGVEPEEFIEADSIDVMEFGEPDISVNDALIAVDNESLISEGRYQADN